MKISRALTLSLFALTFLVFSSLAMPAAAQPRDAITSVANLRPADPASVCSLTHQLNCERPRPPVIYSELNYIDPFGNTCPEGLCTNDIGGVLNTTSPYNGTYHSPGTFWTQSQDGLLHEVRAIVFGVDNPLGPTYSFQDFQDFADFDLRIELWEGFAEFEASPQLGPIRTQANLVPVNENKGIPVGYSSQGHPTFEWVFDVSDYEFALQQGQDYVLVVRVLGSTGLHGWVLRSASVTGSPADVAASTILSPGFVNEPPFEWPVNRLGTEIRVKIP